MHTNRPSSSHENPPHPAFLEPMGTRWDTDDWKVWSRKAYRWYTSLVRLEARPLTPAHRLAQRPPGLTCDVQVEGDLLAPGLAAVLPGICLARLLHHQRPGAALGFHTHFRARTQLLAILVPHHLRLGLGHLAAQRGAGSRHGLHVAACRLLLGKHHRGLWGHRGGCTGSETPPQSGRQPRAEKTWKGS